MLRPLAWLTAVCVAGGKAPGLRGAALKGKRSPPAEAENTPAHLLGEDALLRPERGHSASLPIPWLAPVMVPPPPPPVGLLSELAQLEAQVLVLELLGLGPGGTRGRGAAPSICHTLSTSRPVCWGTVLFYLVRVLLQPFSL